MGSAETVVSLEGDVYSESQSTKDNIIQNVCCKHIWHANITLQIMLHTYRTHIEHI